MSRAIVFLLLIGALFAAALWFLSTQAREVPVQPVEIDVTNDIGS